MLALNCGMGNSDCGQLRFRNVDLRGGWLDYPRPKTGVDRRCPLWKETIQAIKTAIEDRPEPNDDAARDFVFITKYGQPWAKDTMANPISAEFRKLLNELSLHEEGLSFYTCAMCSPRSAALVVIRWQLTASWVMPINPSPQCIASGLTMID